MILFFHNFVVMIVKFSDFSIKKQKDTFHRTKNKYFTVKLSNNLLIDKLGLTLNTCEGDISGITLDDDDDAIY
jgi:hypothetical protein